MDLVVGATGLVGGLVTKGLRERGRAVRALVRGGGAHPKAGTLASAGAVIADGDLTDAASVMRACEGADTIVCTATAMPNAGGDLLKRIDHDGALGLIDAAGRAGAKRFVYISFSGNIRAASPLGDAKRGCEQRLASGRMQFVVLRPSYFMEVWLGPALGFDAATARARIFGDGKAGVSYVSGADVAAFAVAAAVKPGELRDTVEVGGPEPVSQLGAVAIFERATGRRFEVEHVPLAALEAQHLTASDPLQKSFAALSLSYALGDAIPNARENAARYGVSLRSIAGYASGSAQ